MVWPCKHNDMLSSVMCHATFLTSTRFWPFFISLAEEQEKENQLAEDGGNVSED